MFEKRLLLALIVVIGVPAATVGYAWRVESVLGRIRPTVARGLRPWLWTGHVLLLLLVYLIYPTINTFIISFFNANSTEWVGLANYVFIFTIIAVLIALRNNLLWLVFLTLFTVVFGLLFAILFDRVRYESVVTYPTLLAMP